MVILTTVQGSLGSQKWFLCGMTAKPHFITFIFMSVGFTGPLIIQTGLVVIRWIKYLTNCGTVAVLLNKSYTTLGNL